MLADALAIAIVVVRLLLSKFCQSNSASLGFCLKAEKTRWKGEGEFTDALFSHKILNGRETP